MNLGETIRHGTKWLLMGSLGSQVIGFAVGIVLARLLVPQDFGLLVTVQLVTGFVAMVATGGMGEATVQAKEVNEHDYQTMFTVQFAMGAVIYMAFFLLAPWFARYFGQPVYEDLLRVSALSFLVRPFSANAAVRLRRAMRFKETAVIGFVNLIFASALSIGLAWAGFGVWSLVWSGLASAVLSAALLATRAPWRPRLRYDRDSARRLGAYGAKNVLNEILVYFRAQIPNFFVTKLLGPHQVGLYNKADSLARMPVSLLGGSTYQTVFRAMAKAQDDLNQSRYLYFRTLTLLAFYGFPICLTLAFVAEPFVVGLYGGNWRAAALPLAILCAAAPFWMLEMVSGALVGARNRLGRESVLQAQMLVLLGAACFLAVPQGIAAVAWVVVGASAIHALRLAHLALSTIASPWRAVARAWLAPSLLCLPQILVLLLASWGVEAMAVAEPLMRLVLVAGAGLGSYALLALAAPPPSLVAEANRWRRLVRLAPLPSR